MAAVLAVADPADHARRRLLMHLSPAGPPSLEHVVALLAGLSLLVLAPRLLRGTRAALPLAIAALAALATVHFMRPLGFLAAAVGLGLALALAFGRRAFPLGSRNRPRPALAFAASGAWALAYLAVLAGPLFRVRRGTIRIAVHHAIGHLTLPAPHVSGTWLFVIEVLIGCAAAISLLALRSLLRPAAAPAGHSDREYRNARAIVERHGRDSLAPFILRPDKSFHFVGEAVLAYRLIGETAVVSGDPVAAGEDVQPVLESFRALARRQGWEIAVWGASERHLADYHALGLRSVCAGEEAFVDPAQFTLEGRRVRKLRQSVHRLERRGWCVTLHEGRDLDDRLLAEIDAFEEGWRRGHRRLLGYAMGMGPYEPDLRPDDLYVLARAPSGELGAVMRFLACGEILSLDTMHRSPDTPNGLNEALICHALAAARERGFREVSLNYAGLAHLIRGGLGARPKAAHRIALRLLGRRFQMERLVRFDAKFAPAWRPRHLVYESPTALPRAIVRVLQAEGYLPQRRPPRLRLPGRLRPSGGLRTDAAR